MGKYEILFNDVLTLLLSGKDIHNPDSISLDTKPGGNRVNTFLSTNNGQGNFLQSYTCLLIEFWGHLLPLHTVFPIIKDVLHFLKVIGFVHWIPCKHFDSKKQWPQCQRCFLRMSFFLVAKGEEMSFRLVPTIKESKWKRSQTNCRVLTFY